VLLKGSIKSLVPRGFRRTARRIVGRPVPDPVAAWQRLGLLWEAERIELEGERLTISGWMIAPGREAPALLVNGQRVDAMTETRRPDIEAAYPVLAAEPGIRLSGFAAHADAVPEDGWVKVQLERKGEAVGSPFWGYLRETGHDWPEPGHRERIYGEADLGKFRVAGATAFTQLREGLRAVTGLDYTDLPDILEFGCGCGRTTRHFADLPVRLTGADVLPANVAWLRQHLPFARYESIPQRSPTALPSAAFDLAIGVTTFSYLTEDCQFEWLAELRRVVRPGGYVLVTVQGETALVLGRASLRQYRRLLREGIVDRLEEGPDGFLPELGDYRGTFHSEAYLRREWGRYFGVAAVLPAWFGVQDLVVLRRNSS
jgi:SAM-dependent methyltransferase